jgi:hypothetical protein
MAAGDLEAACAKDQPMKDIVVELFSGPVVTKKKKNIVVVIISITRTRNT